MSQLQPGMSSKLQKKIYQHDEYNISQMQEEGNYLRIIVPSHGSAQAPGR